MNETKLTRAELFGSTGVLFWTIAILSFVLVFIEYIWDFSQLFSKITTTICLVSAVFGTIFILLGEAFSSTSELDDENSAT